jgi:pimeloyl-ACP methyl ester carboxylesterase
MLEIASPRRRTLAPTSRRVVIWDVSGSTIYYEKRGVGSAIVLLHDGLLSSPTWDGVWQALAKRHQVIRYDRRA